MTRNNALKNNIALTPLQNDTRNWLGLHHVYHLQQELPPTTLPRKLKLLFLLFIFILFIHLFVQILVTGLFIL